jgi:hypothetical protein
MASNYRFIAHRRVISQAISTIKLNYYVLLYLQHNLARPKPAFTSAVL